MLEWPMASPFPRQRLQDTLEEGGIQDYCLVRGPFRGLESPLVLASALAYPLSRSEKGEEKQPGEKPYALIASFAQVHYYRILAKRLMAIRDGLIGAGASNKGLKRSDFPIHVNSRIDEKLIAAQAGLGLRGRHGILISEKSGCACVVGLMGLPFEPDALVPPPKEAGRHPDCGTCLACARACPSAAISAATSATDGYRRELCIQHHMSSPDQVPASIIEVWGKRLYGCDECLRACPHSQGLLKGNAESPIETIGMLGARVDIDYILQSDDKELRRFFKTSALGLSWLSPAILRRNAALARLDWEKKTHTDFGGPL